MKWYQMIIRIVDFSHRTNLDTQPLLGVGTGQILPEKVQLVLTIQTGQVTTGPQPFAVSPSVVVAERRGGSGVPVVTTMDNGSIWARRCGRRWCRCRC